MTGAVLVAVVIAALVVGVAIARHFAGSPTVGHDRVVEPWFAEARSLIDEGRRLSEQVAGAVGEGAIEARPGIESADTSAGLDRLTRSLAELSATAPTAMDVRVCRSVAIRSRALSEVLRTQHGRDPTRPSNGRSGYSPVVDDRRHEFDVALGDLAEHVGLL